MFAVIRTGGKQYRVEPGAVFDVEKLTGNVGDEVQLGDVLLIGDSGNLTIGRPVVAGARVSAEIVDQKKGKKLTIFKKIRRHGYHLKKGHRQQLTRVRIKDIHAA